MNNEQTVMTHKAHNAATIYPIDDRMLKLVRALVKDALSFLEPTDRLLANFFRQHKTFKPSYKELMAKTVYTVLRHHNALFAIINGIKSVNDGIIINHNEGGAKLIVATWVHLFTCKHIAPHDKNRQQEVFYSENYTFSYAGLCDKYKSLFARFTNIPWPVNILELPSWIVTNLVAKFTHKEIQIIDEALKEAPYFDIRINTLKTTVDNVYNRLLAEGIKVVKMPFSPYGLRLQERVSLINHELFTTGCIEVQDESSQLAAMLLQPKRTDMVVDFCAGSGGKSLLFGMLMHNKGRIYAFDVNKRRLSNLSGRLARSGLSNIVPRVLTSEKDQSLKRLHGKIDKVFVDVPCSGSGTLRHNPDLKFRNNQTKLNNLTLLQLSILQSASKLVKPNGLLVYATCSLLPCENEDIINAFLATDMGKLFAIVPAHTALKLNLPEELIKKSSLQELLILPQYSVANGFFAILLKRIH